LRDDEFERLYAAEAQGLFAFLAYRTGDRALAEDLLADTFERALKARSRFDRRRGSERTWLYAIALNLLRDQARRAAAEARALDAAGPPSASTADHADHLADRDAIQGAMGRLPEPEREALALRFGAELTVPEVAQVLDISLTTAEGRVYRGLRRLREDLGE
jgi:RNA polymerase sigma-70 factor (ECF subfamily)